VTFQVPVPGGTSFGARGHSVVTAADSASATIAFTPPVVGEGEPPGDLDGDGQYEDIDGDGQLTVGDAQTLFANREAAAVLQYIAQYDLNGNGGIDVGDAQALFQEVLE
jgi:hypothetical protein